MFFLPLIIAILLGLVSPATHSNNHCNGGGTVQVNSIPPGGDPDDPDDDGSDGPGSGTGTGGGTSQTPPPRP